jgi:type II secretory pathway pseudopilin PulG
MTERRFEDDEREEPRERERGPTVLPLVVLAGGMIVALLLAAGAALFVIRSRAVQAEQAARAERAARADRAELEQAARQQPVVNEAAEGPPAVEKPKRPVTQAEFKAAVWGLARERVVDMYGAPDEIDESARAAGRHGPATVYLGPFADEKGVKKAKARLWFTRVANDGVVDFIDFID